MIRPSASGSAAQVDERLDAGHAQGDVDDPEAPRPAERVGLTMTAGASASGMPSRAASRSRISRADRSGSSGSSVTQSPRPVFEASTPALAHTKPCFVRLMMRPRSMRMISADSRSTTSTWRASRSQLRGELDRLRPWLDRRQVDQAALRLGHDLLGHDEHVTRAWSERRVRRRQLAPRVGDQSARDRRRA